MAVLLFLLISDELLLALLYFFHFLDQATDLFGVQSLYIDDHCVPDTNFFEKLYFFLCLEFLYFLSQLSQILKLKTRHYLDVVRREISLNRFWKFPSNFIGRWQSLYFFLHFDLKFPHVSLAISPDLMITFLEISGKTDEIRVEFVVFDTV